MSIVSDQATRPLTKNKQYFVDAQSRWERVEARKATFGAEGELLVEAYPEIYDAQSKWQEINEMNLENKEGWERMELNEAKRNVKDITSKADKVQEHYESMRAW